MNSSLKLEEPDEVKGVRKIDKYYEEDLIDLLEYCDGVDWEKSYRQLMEQFT